MVTAYMGCGWGDRIKSLRLRPHCIQQRRKKYTVCTSVSYIFSNIKSISVIEFTGSIKTRTWRVTEQFFALSHLDSLSLLARCRSLASYCGQTNQTLTRGKPWWQPSATSFDCHQRSQITEDTVESSVVPVRESISKHACCLNSTLCQFYLDVV